MGGASNAGVAPDACLLESLLAGRDDAPALIADGNTISRAQLRAAAVEAAGGLAELGLKRGDVLALWLPNGVGWLQLLFAAARLGLLVVPISTRYKAPEVRHLLEVSRARAIVAPKMFLESDYVAIAHGLKSQVATLEMVLQVDDLAAPLRCAARAVGVAGLANDPLCCFSTSGTTGFPKLAVHDHAGIARHATHVASMQEIGAGDSMLCVLPLFGVFGFHTALAALAGGATCVFLPVFDPADAAQVIQRHRITHFNGSDAMFDAIFKVEGADLRSWRRGVFGDFVGLSQQVTRRAEQLGIRLAGVYGSSECFALMSLNPAHMPVERRALAGGFPVNPEIRVRVVNPETDREKPAGEPGEIQIRGPNLMSGYLNNPEASARAMTGDGWFRSGDLGYSEGAGFVYLARMGDSLRLRGFLVSPAEIEACLMQHPSVAGAQVVGVNQPGQGDSAVAWVIGTENTTPDEAALLAHCRANMASYKVPRRVIVIDEFPSINGPNGIKIQKRVLRDMAQTVMA